jgi:flagellar FliL protein
MAQATEAEASDDTEPEGQAAVTKRKFPLKLVIIVVATVLVLGGAGTAAFLMFGGKKSEEQKAGEAPARPVAFVDIPDMVVNLSKAGAERTQYVKIKIMLEVSDQLIAGQIQPLMPRVIDAFQTYLRELRMSDLDGSAGLYRLRDELTRRVNLAIAPNRINAVLFKEIIVQ